MYRLQLVIYVNRKKNRIVQQEQYSKDMDTLEQTAQKWAHKLLYRQDKIVLEKKSWLGWKVIKTYAISQ